MGANSLNAYILRFASMEQRDEFLLWCDRTQPPSLIRVASAENAPTVAAEIVSDAALSDLRRAPQTFVAFEDFLTIPSKETNDKANE